MLLRLLCDIALNILHLLSPTSVILAECFEAAAAGDLVEAGLREQKQCTARGLLQPEFDERGRLVLIYFGIDLPGEGKEPFGLHFLLFVFLFHLLLTSTLFPYRRLFPV